ncbi:hypothetical protein EKI60_06020 [Candidatus Saccharibacteria bacterium]|nr:MAG: hypothetical protein EKI60_06020 [Candidatus Saccharibacteria bacterium]
MGNQEFLERRVKRCIAAILSAKEKNVDYLIPSEAASTLRKVILDEINEFFLLVVDVLNNNVNQDFMDMLEMLEDIHERIVTDGD